MAANQVKVQTSDGNIIDVDLEIAKLWGPINTMYKVLGSIKEEDQPVKLENVNAETLQKIIDWSVQHKQDGFPSEEDEKQRKHLEISKWDQDFFQVKQEMLFEIIMASNYLGITVLLDMACKTVAEMIKNKTPEQVRQTFNIPNDLPPFDLPQEASST